MSDTSLVFSVLAKDRASRVLRVIGDSFRTTGARAEEAMDKATVDSAKLDAELHRVESSLRELNREFARTGDKELFAKMKRDRSLLANLKKIKGELDGVGDSADKAGDKGATGFLEKFKSKMSGLPFFIGSVFSSLPAVAGPAVAVAGVGLAAILLASIGGALSAGMLLIVGGGVLAAGIKAAAGSPKVKAAWSKFGEQAKGAFKDFGKPFEGPVARAAKTFGDSLTRMAPTLKSMGQSMAPIIDKLAPGLAKMAENALPGIQHAMEASKPLFETLAAKAPEIGAAVSKFFDKMAKAAPGANLFLKDLIGVLIYMINSTGDAILMFAKLYEGVHAAWSAIKIAFATGVAFILGVIGQIIHGAAAAFGWIPGLGPKLQAAAHDFDVFAARANAALANIRDKEVTITVSRHEAMFGKPGTAIGGIGGKAYKGLATGGAFKAGDVTWVGEKGPELVAWGASGTVIPAQASAAAMQSGGGGARLGGGAVVVTFDFRGADQEMARALRKMVQIKGQGNVQTAFGS